MKFLIHSLITWRLTLMFLVDNDGWAERGPYGILDKFRDMIGLRWDAYGQPIKTTEIGLLLTCIYCLSVWVGLIVATLSGKHPGYGLALSAATLLIDRIKHVHI